MVDSLSLTSVYIEVFFESVRISNASGFIIKNLSKYFLVTNRHVVTGRHAITDDYISKKGAIGSHLKVWAQKQQQSNYEGVCIDVPLYTRDSDTPELENRSWLEHPKGRAIDVVLVPLNDLKESIHTFNLQLADTSLFLPLTMPISLIGYPLGITSFQKLPFWVTGFIASENEVDKDKLYVNVPGRRGLSGAPVISRQLGGFPDANGNIFMNGIPRDKFVGIYSGRLHDESDIGCIWKPKVINEILASI